MITKTIKQNKLKYIIATLLCTLMVAIACATSYALMPASANEATEAPHYTSYDFVEYSGSAYFNMESGYQSDLYATVDYTLYINNNSLYLGYTSCDIPSGYKNNGFTTTNSLKVYLFDLDTGNQIVLLNGYQTQNLNNYLSSYEGVRIGVKVVGVANSYLLLENLSTSQTKNLYYGGGIDLIDGCSFQFTFYSYPRKQITSVEQKEINYPVFATILNNGDRLVFTFDCKINFTNGAFSVNLDKKLPFSWGDYTSWGINGSHSHFGGKDFGLAVSALTGQHYKTTYRNGDGTTISYGEVYAGFTHGTTYVLTFTFPVYAVTTSTGSILIDATNGLNSQFVFDYYDSSLLVDLPENPTKDGYNFVGWYLDEDFVNPYIDGTPIFNDTDLYAKFEPIIYDINYSLDGGTLDGHPTVRTVEDEIILPTPSRTGYTFDGWYLNSIYTGEVITTIEKGVIGNILVCAKWTINNYTITYNLNGGTLTGGETSYNVGTSTITLKTPTKNGYTFGGWFDNSALTGTAVTTITKGSTGNKTYWAKWIIQSYTIEWEANGATLVGQLTNYTVETATITLPVLTRVGHVFKGWYSNSNFTGDVITEIAQGSTGNKALFAKWEIVTYKVTFYVDGVEFCVINVPHGFSLADITTGQAMLTALNDVFIDPQMTVLFVDEEVTDDITLYGTMSDEAVKALTIGEFFVKWKVYLIIGASIILLAVVVISFQIGKRA